MMDSKIDVATDDVRGGDGQHRDGARELRFGADRRTDMMSRRSRAGVAVSLFACAILSACGVAPGMRMPGTATLAVTSSEAGTPSAEVQVPITDITLSLIEAMHAAKRTSDAPMQLLDTPPRSEQGYAIGPGDVLQVTVWDHPELAAALGPQPATATAKPFDPGQGFVVEQDGNLQFPFAGSVHVAGLTAAQAQQRIVTALSNPRMFRDPAVTVRVLSYRAKQVYVDGEVHAPGIVPINDMPMSLLETVSRAGGFTPNADQSHMALVRDGVSYPLDLPRMIARGVDPAHVLLKSGDMLRVLARTDNAAYVLGEVARPTVAVPLGSGELTLGDAISQAGSLSSTSADAAQIYVVRGTLGTTPQVFRLDAHSPVAMVLANEFELKPKDVVYVDGNGLVRFSRILGLLLPAINAGLTAAVVTK